jgi:hypothetical protein
MTQATIAIPITVTKITKSYSDHEKISDSAHDAFLRDLIQIHPDAAEKIGAGVDYFAIKHDDKTGKTRHFIIHRVDGSLADFSWHCCIDGRDWRRETIQSSGMLSPMTLWRFEMLSSIWATFAALSPDSLSQWSARTSTTHRL